MITSCILQVEDEANDVFLLQRALVEEGIHCPVKVATDGQMAIEYLEGSGPFANRSKFPLPSLMLLDLKLPRRSGREVLEWVRLQPGLRRLVVIVFTGALYVGDIGLAYDLGANSFIIKPQDFSQYSKMARSLKEWWLQLNQFAPLTDANWVAPFPLHDPVRPLIVPPPST